MYTQENKNKDGQVISIRFFCAGKDPLTQKNKTYGKTFKIPKNLTKKELENEKLKFEVDFRDEVRKKSLGLSQATQNISFIDFSEKWLQSIITRNKKAHCHYQKSKNDLKVIQPYFQKYTLQQINPNIIQDFYDYICDRSRIKEVVRVKKSISQLLEQAKQAKCKIAEEIGINRLTLRLANQINNRIDMTTAKRVSKYFNVPIREYFDIQYEEVPYSDITNEGIKTTLRCILSEAKRRRLIEHNFASSEYTKFPKVKRNKKDIYTPNEFKEFVNCLKNETNIRARTAITIVSLLGLRREECVAIRWSSINFEEKTISIHETATYTPTFKVQQKDNCKTESSVRVVKMPDMLYQTLKEYYEWWKIEKEKHGDLWDGKDLLFMQDNGKVINPCTASQWVTKYECANGFKHVSIHMLRHCIVSLLHDLGTPIKVIAELVGHSLVSTSYKHYIHTFDEQIVNAVNKCNDFLTKEEI